MMAETGASMLGGLVFFVVWALMMAAMLGGWIVFLIAIWRGMKAHESVAASLRRIADREP